MRVAHGLVVKGYARPAFGGTSCRRSIMKNHQLSWWVPFSTRLIHIEEFSAQVAMLHGRLLFAFRSPRAGAARGLRRVREGVQAVGERHKVRRRTIPVRRPLFRGIYHLIIPLIPESSFRRSYLRFFNLFLFVLVG